MTVSPLLYTIGLVCEIAAGVAAFAPHLIPQPFPWYAAHGAAVVCWTVAVALDDAAGKGKDPMRPVVFGGLVCAAVFPFVGALLALAMVAAHASVERVAMYEDETPEPAEVASSSHSRAEYRALVRETIDFESYVDILAGVDRALKIKVISRLAGLKDPISVRVLRTALHDADPEVRLYASSAMFKLEISYHQDLSRALKSRRRRGLLDDRLRYADACRAYADAGLVDADASMHHRTVALEEYLAVCKDEPGHKEAAVAAVMLLIEMGRFAHAAGLLPSVSGDPAVFHAAKARLAFEQGKTDETVMHLSAIPGATSYVPADVKEFWCHDAP